MKPRLDALELALALYRAPREIERVRARPLPEGMSVLFRCAGADAATLATCVEATAAKERDLIEAARFYVQHVLLADDDNPYRVLGLPNGADPAAVKEHHRLLIRYLHPDRSEGTWLDVYAERINKAWSALRTPERRVEVDRYLAAGGGQQGPIADHVLPAFVRGPAVPVDVPQAGAGKWLAAAAVVVGLLMAGALYFDSLTPQTPDGVEWTAASDATPDGADVSEAPAADVEAASAVEEPVAAPDVDALAVPDTAVSGSDAETVAASDAALATPAEAMESSASETAVAPPVASAETPEPAQSPVAEPVAPVATAAAPRPEREAATVREPIAPRPVSRPATAPEPVRVARVEPRITAAPSPPLPPSRDDIDDVLQSFRSAYARGDLAHFLSLFSADAKSRTGGIEAIAADYRTFFADSSIRAIAFDELQLFNDGPTAIAKARFVARITPRTAFEAIEVRGDIQFDIRRSQDRVLIARLLHQERK